MSYDSFFESDTSCDTTDGAGASASRNLLPDMTDNNVNSIFRRNSASDTNSSVPGGKEVENVGATGTDLKKPNTQERDSPPQLDIELVRKQEEFNKRLKQFEKEGLYLKKPEPENLLKSSKIADLIRSGGLSKEVLDAVRNSISCNKFGSDKNPITEINQELKKHGLKLEIDDTDYAPIGLPIQGGCRLVYAELVKIGEQTEKKPVEKPGEKFERKPLYIDGWNTVYPYPFTPPYRR